jgi:hypothetical protein
MDKASICFLEKDRTMYILPIILCFFRAEYFSYASINYDLSPNKIYKFCPLRTYGKKVVCCSVSGMMLLQRVLWNLKNFASDYSKSANLILDNQQSSDHVLLVCPVCFGYFRLNATGSRIGEKLLYFSKYSFMTW